MNKNSVIFLVMLILLLGGGYFTYNKYKKGVEVSITPVDTTAPAEQSSIPSAPSTSSPSTTMGKTVVDITATGFSPSIITINAGENVTWTNQDTIDHTVNSAGHPTHLLYPLLNLGVITPGNSKSLPFPAAGIYKYHDHLHPSLVGQVVVK